MFIRRLVDSDEDELASFFDGVAGDGTAERFRPHPFTPAEAKRVAEYTGKDLYFGAWVEKSLAGYGMLRGWDAGFAVPALGVYVAPMFRGNGVATSLVERLHACARYAGARRIRLKVFPDNLSARRIYEAAGYTFDGTIERGECVGFCEL